MTPGGRPGVMSACLDLPTMRSNRHAIDAGSAGRVSGAPSPSLPTATNSSWLLLFVVLAGLFAMHGLGTHGTHAAHTAEPMSGVSTGAMSGPGTQTTSVHDDETTILHTSAPPDVSAYTAHTAMLSRATGAMSSPVEHHGVLLEAPSAATGQMSSAPAPLTTGGLLGLCFAVLTALVAWLLARGGNRRAVAVVSRASRVVASRCSGRDRDPPSLLILSVHRC